MVFGINPVDFDVDNDVTVLNKFGTETSLNDWLSNVFAPVWEPFYRASDSLVEAEIWSKPTPESDPLFIKVLDIADVGSSASTIVPYSQGVLTLRTEAGGITKVYLMETVFAVNTHDPRPFADTRVSALSAALTASASVWYGRDNSYPIIGLNWNTKTNDALRKKYLLNV